MPANSSATVLSLHSDEGYCRSALSSPSSQGLMSLTPSAAPRATDGDYGWGEGKEKALLFHIQFCYSACQRQLNARAEGLKGKANFVRNAGAPLRTGSTEPTLNSSFHLLRPSHLLGHNHKEVEIAVHHPSITGGIVPVQ